MFIQQCSFSILTRTLLVGLLIAVWGGDLSLLSAQSEVKIVRFDRRLYEAIENQSQPSVDKLARTYPSFMKVYSDGVIKRPMSELMAFFNNASLMALYGDAVKAFEDVSELEKELQVAFVKMNQLLNRREIPQVYMHVSGISQSIVVGEGFVSISIDKYLGTDYPLYKKYLYDYQSKLMVKERIVSDCVRAWLYSEFPFSPKDKNLLTYMLYEGRIMTILQSVFSDKPSAVLFGYTPEEWNRAIANEKRTWAFIVGQKHLYSQDPILIAKFINEGPNSGFLSPDMPDRQGIFIGTRIAEAYKKGASSMTVDRYMEETPQDLLAKARYKP